MTKFDDWRKPMVSTMGKPGEKFCYNNCGSDITPSVAKSFD